MNQITRSSLRQDSVALSIAPTLDTLSQARGAYLRAVAQWAAADRPRRDMVQAEVDAVTSGVRQLVALGGVS